MFRRLAHHTIGITVLCLLLSACSGSGVQFDPDKPHHGEGEFVSVKRGSFMAHYEMRQREGDPPEPTAEEIASIVTTADLDLISSRALPGSGTPRRWCSIATSISSPIPT